jgi:hypothetical protein
MLLIVLTSISVVVAARRQRELKIYRFANKAINKKILSFDLAFETESQHSKIERLRASAQCQKDKTSVLS